MTSTPLEGLLELARVMRSVDVPFCLVGGLAISVRAEVRFTRDIDLCVVISNDRDAEGLIFKLQTLGYRVLATVKQQKHGRLATARLRGPQGVICDLLMASSGIEREVVERAASVEIEAGQSIPVARVEELIALKVLSATAMRPLDTADIQQLLAYNPDANLMVVRENLTLIESRGYHREQELASKLDAILASLKSP